MESLSILFSNDKVFLQRVKCLTGFYPRNAQLYRLAFRNKSGTSQDDSEIPGNNERLEYLGDAILGSVIAEFLFKRFPFKDEGFLTEMRSKIVSRHHLNKLALKLGLDEFILEDRDTISKSVYGNAFEALVGAIYLDRGHKTTTGFIVGRILKHHVDLEELENTELNFKGKLIDWGQKERKEIIFELVEEIVDGRDKKYRIAIKIDGDNRGEAVDFSKKRAEQKAAELALHAMGLMGANDKEEK